MWIASFSYLRRSRAVRLDSRDGDVGRHDPGLHKHLVVGAHPVGRGELMSKFGGGLGNGGVQSFWDVRGEDHSIRPEQHPAGPHV